MAKTFADFQQAVANRIQDAAGKLAQDAIDECIRQALAGEYSSARPLRRITAIAGDSATFSWLLIAAAESGVVFPGWVDGFSAILALEYPAGERVPVYLDKEDWAVVQTATGFELRLLVNTPQTGKTLNAVFTVPHAADATTVPDVDFFGAADLAASLAARRLAALYAQLGDASVGLDAVNYQSKSGSYHELARALEREFRKAFGLERDKVQPAASVTAEWKQDLADGGERLTH